MQYYRLSIYNGILQIQTYLCVLVRELKKKKTSIRKGQHFTQVIKYILIKLMN